MADNGEPAQTQEAEQPKPEPMTDSVHINLKVKAQV